MHSPKDLRRVLEVLAVIEAPPGLRTAPRSGDLEGTFTQWFDGGAIAVITGWNEYHFSDGTFAVVPTTPSYRVEIRLPSGAFFVLTEEVQAPPNLRLFERGRQAFQ
jgi:hypothetical protein